VGSFWEIQEIDRAGVEAKEVCPNLVQPPCQIEKIDAGVIGAIDVATDRRGIEASTWGHRSKRLLHDHMIAEHARRRGMQT